jgi:hypothetical protein
MAVIGLGNLLMRDEGAGLHALKLIENAWHYGDIDFVYAGTPSFGLLHQFEGRKKIIFIDGGMCGVATYQVEPSRGFGDQPTLNQEEHYRQGNRHLFVQQGENEGDAHDEIITFRSA